MGRRGGDGDGRSGDDRPAHDSTWWRGRRRQTTKAKSPPHDYGDDDNDDGDDDGDDAGEPQLTIGDRLDEVVEAVNGREGRGGGEEGKGRGGGKGND